MGARYILRSPHTNAEITSTTVYGFSGRFNEHKWAVGQLVHLGYDADDIVAVEMTEAYPWDHYASRETGLPIANVDFKIVPEWQPLSMPRAASRLMAEPFNIAAE